MSSICWSNWGSLCSLSFLFYQARTVLLYSPAHNYRIALRECPIRSFFLSLTSFIFFIFPYTTLFNTFRLIIFSCHFILSNFLHIHISRRAMFFFIDSCYPIIIIIVCYHYLFLSMHVCSIQSNISDVPICPDRSIPLQVFIYMPLKRFPLSVLSNSYSRSYYYYLHLLILYLYFHDFSFFHTSRTAIDMRIITL